jgi:hypothetical protein
MAEIVHAYPKTKTKKEGVKGGVELSGELCL